MLSQELIGRALVLPGDGHLRWARTPVCLGAQYADLVLVLPS